MFVQRSLSAADSSFRLGGAVRLEQDVQSLQFVQKDYKDAGQKAELKRWRKTKECSWARRVAVSASWKPWTDTEWCSLGSVQQG